MTATPAYLEFAPPPPPGTGRSLGLALLVHLLLMVALTAGIQWNQDNSLSVEAELWAAVPMAVAPKLVEVEPPPPPPPPPPAPKEMVKPPPEPTSNVDADIALAKRKKQLEEDKKKQEVLEAERLKKEQLKKEEEKKAKLKEKEQKEIKDKALKEKELKEKEKKEKEKERKEKELKDKEAKKLQEQKDAKPTQTDIKKIEALRQKEIERIIGLAKASGDENATGIAMHAAGPSDSYGGRISQRVKNNIVFNASSIIGNPEAKFILHCAPDGTILFPKTKLIQSSGYAAYDDAALRGLEKTKEIPRDKDGRLFCPFEIVLRPKD
jgi:colicin import membrane protein